MRTTPERLCGHFNTHGTVVTDTEDVVTSRQFCSDCRCLLRTFPGREVADHMQRMARRRKVVPGA